MATTTIFNLLNQNSGAIQAVSTVVLVLITAIYAWFTWKMSSVMASQITPDIKIDNIVLGSELCEEWAVKEISKGNVQNYMNFILTFDVRNSGAGSGSIDKPFLVLKFENDSGSNNYTIPPRTKNYEEERITESMSRTIETDLGGTIHLAGGHAENIELVYPLHTDEYLGLKDNIKNNLKSLQTLIVYKDNFGKIHRDRVTDIHSKRKVGRK